jgi:hypothetical protein
MVVALSVCVSVTTLTATYLVCESKLQCCKVPCGVPNTCYVDFAENVLFTRFADDKLLDFSQAYNVITFAYSILKNNLSVPRV